MRYRYSKGKNGKTEKKAIVYTQDEHRIDISYVDKDAAYICSRLKTEGFETYIVGGAVRDLVLGKKPKDFDIASAASPSQIKKIFRNSRVIGKRFRLVHVYYGAKIIEVATFRSMKDGGTGNTFGTIEDDVLRRDFTFNALFYDPEQEVVIDYVGGLEDIWNKRIRPIISMKNIFIDDPVRMIRVVKYSVLSGFPIPLLLGRRIKNQAHLISGVSPSRLTEEINKIIYSSNVAAIIKKLDEMGLYEYLQPNAYKLMKKSLSFRKAYFSTLVSLNSSEKENSTLNQNQIDALSALFYDYVEGVIDWSNEQQALYKHVLFEARKFILPMNSQRSNMEKAVKQIFAEHGINIRKIMRPSYTDPTAQTSVSEEGSGKVRRRRCRKSSVSSPQYVPSDYGVN